MILKLFKFQACGNDFVIYDEEINPHLDDQEKADFAKEICRRNFSVGADGLLFVSRQGDFYRLRIIEQDGSESDMCGNGIRCAAAYFYLKEGLSKIVIKTNSGSLDIEQKKGMYQVNMGSLKQLDHYFTLAKLEDRLISFKEDRFSELQDLFRSLSLSPEDVFMVNPGEPHVIILVDDIYKKDINSIGEKINSRKDLFPFGTNVNLVEKIDSNRVINRTYERGVWNETLSCGTGSTAAAVVSKFFFCLPEKEIIVDNKGGFLKIGFEGEFITLLGPAELVFECAYNWKEGGKQ